MTNEPMTVPQNELDHHKMMGEALIELRKNKNFQMVVEEGYLNQKVLASVSLLATPHIIDNNKRPRVMEDLVAASNLQYYFQTIDSFYHGVTAPVLSDEEEAALVAEQE